MVTKPPTNEKLLIITGGGTGGHLYPALAVVEALRKERPGLNMLYVSRDHERDRTEVEKRNIPFQGFQLEGLQRKITPGNIRALWKFAKAFFQCWSIMRKHPRGVVFGVGGYVSAPAMTAGKWLGWRVALHEQNAIPGLVNRFLAPRCNRVFVTYESSQQYLSGVESMVTGLPIRNGLLEASARNASHTDNQTPSILLIGGSQGARKAVEISLQTFRILDERGISYQATVQTGERNFEWAQSLPQANGVTLIPFIHDMANAYREAGVVISRAGSGSLSEIALWERPSILIPYPYASENHQVMNAKTFVEAGAAIVIEEKELSPDSLADRLIPLLHDETKRKAMSLGAASLARRDAAHVIAMELLQLLDR